jgi:hypothetical protein
MLAVEFEGLGWLGVRTERFEETVRFYRNGMVSGRFDSGEPARAGCATAEEGCQPG